MFASSSGASADAVGGGEPPPSSGAIASGAAVQPVPVPDEPDLLFLPDDLSPIYRPVPIAIQASVWLLSAAIAAGTWFRPLHIPNWKKVVWFFAQTMVVAGVTSFVAQDLFWGPSRVSIQTLTQRYFLPSKLSVYKQISVNKNLLLLAGRQQQSVDASSDDEVETLGVHFLKSRVEFDENDSMDDATAPTNSPGKFRALYVNHGFGASSLSWLPAIGPLQRALRIPVAMGHDAPGFGFTERKRGRMLLFTSKASAAIGLELLRQQLRQQQQQQRHSMAGEEGIKSDDGTDTTETTTSSPVLLMGHSMGAITTLRMALGLGDAPKHVVLVSPALGVRGQRKAVDTNQPHSRFKRSILFGRRQLSRCLSLPRTILDTTSAYILRRVVGAKNSWRTGLRVAWGDPDRLSDSDVLRFQWPSIGSGWESGLLTFARAQSLPTDLTDRELMESVLKLPNTKVLVIVGRKDRIVPVATVREFIADFPSVEVVELDGLGHDPFEEDKQSFVRAMEDLYPNDDCGDS